MAPKATSTKPLKQAPISFLTQRASSARSSKAKQGKLSASVTDAPQTTAAISDAVDAVEILAASDIEDAEPTALHAMEDDEVSDDEPEPAAASRNGGGKRAIAPAKKGKGKKEEEDDIVDFEEEKEEEEEKPPKKKRRVSARTAKSAAASIEAPSEGDSGAPTKKGKGKQAKGKKSLSKSVFRSREGVENSESNKDTDWATESKNIKISAKGNGTSAVGKHVDIAAMRKHFGYVREKQGNVMPIHAKSHSMEDHILRFFDLSYEYGPCIGVTRLQRWERAEALGLNPPEVVQQLLTNEDGTERTEVKECVFFGEI